MRDVIHADPNFRVDGVFTAPPAAGIPVRLTVARRDPVADFRGFETRARVPAWEAHLSQAEVPTRPRARVDQLTFYSLTFTINDVAEDVEQTEWVCDLGG